jgi:hypothetical protein
VARSWEVVVPAPVPLVSEAPVSAALLAAVALARAARRASEPRVAAGLLATRAVVLAATLATPAWALVEAQAAEA